jgi:hypothetical protein
MMDDEENSKPLREPRYMLKMSGTVYFVDGTRDTFENVEVQHIKEKSIVHLKNKIEGFDFFRNADTYILENVKKIETQIDHIKVV